MITLGALLVGLLLLLMLLGALAWMQRRARRGPEQPRTVADLVRMREAARPQAVPADNDPTPDVVDGEPTSVELESVPEPAGVPPHATVSRAELPTVDEQATTTDPAMGAALSTPEDAAVDTPWARAARMAEPWMEWSAESDEPEPSSDTHARPSIALLPTYPTVRPAASPAVLPEPAPVVTPAASPAVLPEPLPVPLALRQVASPPAPVALDEVLLSPPVESTPRAVAPVEVPSSPANGQAPPPSVPWSPAAELPSSAVPDEAPPPPAASAVARNELAAPQTPAVPSATADGPSAEHAPHEPEPAMVPFAQPVGPVAAETGPSLPTNGHGPVPTPARVAGRARRSPTATAAEQAAADLALLRTFGVARPAADEPDVALEGCATDDDEPAAGTAQPVAFRVLARNGRGISGATVTLLDDHGRETASIHTDPDGHGVLTARHPGGYLLVVAADGYQPGAITVAVTDEPVDAEIPLTRSASITGLVGGEDGPIVGAQLALIQDGEIVDTAQSAADGTYRFRDLAAGGYGLSVTAHECEPAALVLELADEADLRQDVELAPAGLPSDDVMIGPR